MDTTLFKQFKITSDTVIVLGCSYGPDSMALFHLLLEMRKDLPFKLVVAHVNHNKRKESIQEKEALEAICEKNSVPFEYMKIEKYGDDNFHNEARNIRYHFFEQICNKYKANYLMTAHHADDLMETILMRLVRGSTLKGYAGFEKCVQMSNYQIVRPLYEVTKDEILSYCKRHKIPYAIDASNFKSVYTRNRYRKEILPFLKKEDPNVHLHFIQFHKKLMEANQFIEKEIEKRYHSIVKEDPFELDILKWKEQEPFLQKEILSKLLSNFYEDDLVLLSLKHVELLFEMLHRKASSITIHLPNEVEAIKSYNTFLLRKKTEEIDSYEIEVSSYVKLPNGHSLEQVSSCDETTNAVTRLSSKEVTLPLYVRTRRVGDKMTLKGKTGHKKVKDILMDAKIPRAQRELWPVVVDAKGEIVFLPNLKKSQFDKKKTENYDIILKYQ